MSSVIGDDLEKMFHDELEIISSTLREYSKNPGISITILMRPSEETVVRKYRIQK